MDAWLIVIRIAHVGSAMIRFGRAIIGGLFLTPTAEALGKADSSVDRASASGA